MMSCEEIISTQHPKLFLYCWKQDFNMQKGTLAAAQHYPESEIWGEAPGWSPTERQKTHPCGSRIAWVLIQLHNVSVSFFRHENHGLWLRRTDRKKPCMAPTTRTRDLCCLLVLPPSWASAGLCRQARTPHTVPVSGLTQRNNPSLLPESLSFTLLLGISG